MINPRYLAILTNMQSPTSSFTFTLFLTTKNNLLLLLLLHVSFIIMVCADHQGDGFSESECFFSFDRAIDPQNVLHIDARISSSSSSSSSHPCMMKKLKGVIRCDSEGGNNVEIRLEKMNLSGTIDAESPCRLKKLRVLSLAENNITGKVSNLILHCSRLSYLNLSNNHPCGKILRGLMMKLKFLRKFDMSNNNFNHHLFPHSLSEEEEEGEGGIMQSSIEEPPVTNTITVSNNDDDEGEEFSILYVLVIGIILLFLGFYFASIQVGQKSTADNNNNNMLKNMNKFHITKAATDEIKEEEEIRNTADDELVFFEESERFRMEDLLEASAELRSESFCSCLYKVRLKNNNGGGSYAVKRLKNLKISANEFSETLRKVSKLKHPNILPLVGYRSASEEKLVIYRYQNNGSFLDFFKGT